ncbi:MAG: sporulation protein [Oscillospiraceae bacterium]|nr:sporulation protein [Oscillospiraceae bacterium]
MTGLLEKLSERLDLPAEALAGAPRVTLTGSDRVLVENHRGLLNYTETELEIACGHGHVRVRGADLLLRAMDERMLLITGRVTGVDVD